MTLTVALGLACSSSSGDAPGQPDAGTDATSAPADIGHPDGGGQPTPDTGPGGDGPPPPSGDASGDLAAREGGAINPDLSSMPGPDTAPLRMDTSAPGDCVPVDASLLGTYRIARTVLVHDVEAPVTYSQEGTRHSDGATYAINATIEASARDFKIRGSTTKNGLGYFNPSSEGTWFKMGNLVIADGLGDTLYRRRFTTAVDGCSLKLKQIPRDPSATASLDQEPLEIDLVRTR